MSLDLIPGFPFSVSACLPTLPSPPPPSHSHTHFYSSLSSRLPLPSPLSHSLLLALLDPLPNAQMLSSFAFSAKYSRLHSSCLPAPLPATLPAAPSLTTPLLLLLLLPHCCFLLQLLRLLLCPAFSTFDFDKLLLRFSLEYIHRPKRYISRYSLEI